MRKTVRNWDDVRILLECSRHGSFSAAAKAIGVDQATISRRIGSLEKLIGRPLFERRRGGAVPTKAGEIAAQAAEMVEHSMHEFERVLIDLQRGSLEPVRIGASGGVVYYLLTPALFGTGIGPLNAPEGIEEKLPPIAFSDFESLDNDIVITPLPFDHVPEEKGEYVCRRVGYMRFSLHANRIYANKLRDSGAYPRNIDDIIYLRLLNISFYNSLPGLDIWRDLLSRRNNPADITFPNTNALHQFIVEEDGITLLPNYSFLYDDRIQAVDVATPELGFSLWMLSHEDRLREPNVRFLFDTISQMFLSSKWFR